MSNNAGAFADYHQLTGRNACSAFAAAVESLRSSEGGSFMFTMRMSTSPSCQNRRGRAARAALRTPARKLNLDRNDILEGALFQ